MCRNCSSKRPTPRMVGAKRHHNVARSQMPHPLFHKDFQRSGHPGNRRKRGVAGVARICRDTFHPKLKQVRIVGRCRMEPAGPGSREPDQRWPGRRAKYGYLKIQIQPQNGKGSGIRAAAKSRAAPINIAAKDRPSPAGAGKDYSAGQQGGKGLLSRAADNVRAAGWQGSRTCQGRQLVPADLQQAIRYWKRQGGRMPTTQGRQGGAGITLWAGLLLC